MQRVELFLNEVGLFLGYRVYLIVEEDTLFTSSQRAVFRLAVRSKPGRTKRGASFCVYRSAYF